jgi:hypothetical protein
MLIHIHQTTDYFTRSILRTRPVTNVEVRAFPDDPQDFADRHDGDYLEVAPGEDDHEQVRHDGQR